MENSDSESGHDLGRDGRELSAVVVATVAWRCQLEDVLCFSV